ncbi:MAG: NAD-dependent epimerase/dehydratase family protein [Desulfomonile tiedjei]|uniref:NAD-dependent epimerase/dehydratase family protein n=1 Tax=Desulfomonile tiedjei TaxID=2358 RepID=A0A9D6Z3B6_9BACT|nr:NAD-dependent epimerase/dehydratase family protein [Desulfomonile tiedjei]
MKTLVTGGAGFIGSHLVDELLRREHYVVVYDNLSTGFKRHLEPSLSTARVELAQADILDGESLARAMEGVSTVFHLAANADVRGGRADRNVDLQQNIIGTHQVLEAMVKKGVKSIVFTSSATVYGEPDRFPTPEDYAPVQTSLYGASKLAAEAMIQSYSEYFGITSHVFRFVSWIGERYSHGVIFDFMNKLRSNTQELEILGDGNQKKSYLHVEDGVRGMFEAIEGLRALKNVVNLGHTEYMKVTDLAEIVCEEMGLKNVSFRYTGGIRGWIGDSPFVHLDISKIRGVGFTPRVTIEEGVRRTARYLLENPWLLHARPL